MVKTSAITFRTEPEIKEALEKAAKADGRTVASYVERLVIAHLEQHFGK
tara:strand:+ start:749 stop:895 length:147 start_codon:yes stop_codon:yes gene_type:complete